MKIFEVLNLHNELLTRLRDAGVRMNDVCYVSLYNEYTGMLSDGEKVSYIVAFLAQKHEISERKVYSLIKHLQTDCTFRTA